MKNLKQITEGFFQNSGSGFEVKKKEIADLVEKHTSYEKGDWGFRVNDDLSVDFEGEVEIHLPVNTSRIGFKINKIVGSLDVYINQGFKGDLSELPDEVPGHFTISGLGGVYLNSLSGMPKKIFGNINISINVLSLEGMPKICHKNLTIHSSLTHTLKGCTQEVKYSFDICNAMIENFEGGPTKVGKNYSAFTGCDFIDSFKGLPQKIGGMYKLKFSKITNGDEINYIGKYRKIDLGWDVSEVPKPEFKKIKNQDLKIEMIKVAQDAAQNRWRNCDQTWKDWFKESKQ